MKKLLPIILCLALLCLSLTACDLIDSIFNPPCQHTEVTDEAVQPTCTKTGLTEGSHCSECGEIIKAQTEVAALGHKTVIDEAVLATCTTDGLTSGAHCSVCDETLIAQEIIPASHSLGEWIDTVSPDCFNPGEKTRSCSACDLVETLALDPLDHVFVKNEETQLFSCEACDARILNGHLYAAFDVEVSWYDAYKACEALGGHLVTITSEAEQLLISDIMGTSQRGVYLIGGYLNSDGWRWITGEDFSYTNWLESMPDNHAGIEWFINVYGSASVHTAGAWNDIDAGAVNHKFQDYEVGFICEWELDIEESEHFFTEWSVSKPADCFSDGMEWRICTHCGEYEEREIPANEHNFVTAENSSVAICEHCGAGLFEGNVYAIIKNSVSWFSAYTACDNLGGHLVTITSYEEQAFLEEYMRLSNYSSRAWIGAYRDGTEWQWVTDEEFVYTNWNSGEPNNNDGVEFFCEINNKVFGEWNDNPPLNTKYFICEWESVDSE